MSNLTLALDVGVNSVGFCVIDETNKEIRAAGVRIFPEGVDRDQQGGEKSKNQTRRTARGMRRQIARRNRHKRVLREMLVKIGLLPDDPIELAMLLSQGNPYDLRRKALDEKLTLHQLGRMFLHFAQRRGFLSNRRTDKATESDTKGMKADMSELDERIKESGSRTMGEYFAKKLDEFDHRASGDRDRIRKWHTRRISEDEQQFSYEKEFHAIWDAQQKHNPDLLTDKLKYGSNGKENYPKRPARLGKENNLLSKYGVYGLIFFQRKMYWPKSVIGRCELERREKRCPKADRAAQRFRILQEVNNLKILDRSTGNERRLTDEERATVVDSLMTTKEQSFEKLRTKLGFLASVQFNFERGDRSKLKGHETDAKLSSKNGVGARWKKLDDETKDAVVDILIHETQEDDVLRRLTDDCGLTDDEATRAAKVHLPEGYLNICRVAIEKLLPHLERGLLLMADDESNSALHAAGYLRPDEREIRQQQFLPPSPDLPNPIVRQALVEVRKVVNSIIREFGKPVRIHVELAREAKKSFEERKEIRFTNAKRRKERETARVEIESFAEAQKTDIKPTRNTVNRFRLWKEQNMRCVYCGQEISQAQLFGGDADVDHILPRWRSLDDSLANKVICHRRCNEEKADQTPREWLEDSNPVRYQTVLQAIKNLSYGKQRKFQQKDIELADFVERQLRDTAYISRCVTQYLRCLGVRIVCPRGQMTAELRHWWGLNTILSEDGTGVKNRADHRHHAVDALVLALTNEKRLFALANAKGKDMPFPWEGFRKDAEQVILGIHVSHRGQGKLNGALHEATMYGPTQKRNTDETVPGREARPWAKDWIEDDNAFVRRKAVTELTSTKHLDKVRDPVIREILKQHLRDRGIDPEKTGKIPGETFKGDNLPRMPSGVPIKRVRMIEESETFRKVSDRRQFQFVKPGNNHHITYRATGQGSDEKWTAEVVTTWDAAGLARSDSPQPVVDRRDNESGRFVMSLSIGEMFVIQDENREQLLCVVRKIDQRSKRVYYKRHTDARQAGDINKDNLYLSPKNMLQRRARKVTVDPLGRIRWASD